MDVHVKIYFVKLQSDSEAKLIYDEKKKKVDQIKRGGFLHA